jgi:hypothetical protein
MPTQLAGFPHWELRFDEAGRLVEPEDYERLSTELPQQQLTDLFILSHGWNNNQAHARAIYERFFGQMQSILQSQRLLRVREAKIGTVGILWPSMRWADEDVPFGEGGAASFDGTHSSSNSELLTQLKQVFPNEQQQVALDEMAQLLDLQLEDNEALARFHALMGELATSKDVVIAPEDNGEASGLLEQSPVQVFERLGAEVQPMSDEGGAAGFGNPFRLLWADAKEALRQATYWEMKKRAGIIGKSGLGSVIDKIRQVQPNLQIHLVGHSFGARLVSYALLGLSQAHETPIRSLVLMQGAFSHWAFAQPLPFDPARNGALADMEQQGKGVIVVMT